MVEAGGVESQTIENQEDTHPGLKALKAGQNQSHPGQPQDVRNDPNVELGTPPATTPDSFGLQKSTILAQREHNISTMKPHIPMELIEVIKSWNYLPPDVKVSIMTLVKLSKT